ncbi:MAG: DUF2267 domain-containing protein [Phycisphaerae bacterium]|nr:DUF2267 domain-containing protein [Phycisphaerae bacterium]
MTTTGLTTLDHSLATTHEWLEDLREEMSLDDHEQALAVMRAVLQTLRDRLTVEEAAEFAAQLPMLLQGVYYHGWTPAGKPQKIRTRDEFLTLIADRLMGNRPPEESARAVFKVLANRMTAGQINDLKSTLPDEIRQLWSEA